MTLPNNSPEPPPIAVSVPHSRLKDSAVAQLFSLDVNADFGFQTSISVNSRSNLY
jgi:hypothetical protein